MDFIAKIPDNLPDIIENNGDEVKAWLSQVMQKYQGIVVTAETVKSAKDDKAKLTRLRNALEDRRKEVKRDYLAPYMRFEQQYKEILALIDEPISSIDSQIKALDEQEATGKYNRLQEFFAATWNSMEIEFEIDFDKILNPKWKNKTMKEETLFKEITERVEEINNDVTSLCEYYSETPHYTAIMDCYRRDYDMKAALAYAQNLIKQDEQRAQREAQAQERQRDAQQAHREPEEVPTQVNEPEQEKPVQDAQEAPANDQVVSAKFKATGKLSQLRKARDYMLELGIKLESIN